MYVHYTSLKTTFAARAGEWFLSLGLFIFSLMLIINDDLFLEAPRAYGSMALLLDQYVWGLLFFCVASTRFAVLAINGTWRRSPILRAAGAFLSCLLWFSLTVGFLKSGVYGFVLALAPVLLAFDTFNTLRAIRDAAEVDTAHALLRSRQHARSSR